MQSWVGVHSGDLKFPLNSSSHSSCHIVTANIYSLSFGLYCLQGLGFFFLRDFLYPLHSFWGEMHWRVLRGREGGAPVLANSELAKVKTVVPTSPSQKPKLRLGPSPLQTLSFKSVRPTVGNRRA